MDIGDGTCLQPLIDIVRNFGREQVVGVLRQHARDVKSHVAVSDDRDLAGLERPLARNVGVTVEPTDEVCRAIRTVEVDSGD